MAVVHRRFAKTPRSKYQEGSRAISAGLEGFQPDDSLRSSRQAHADNGQARSKSAVIRRAELASQPRVPPVQALNQMPTRLAPQVAETNARRYLQRARALVRL